jgi:diguanylate cyclase (GGDEF)-like protein
MAEAPCGAVTGRDVVGLLRSAVADIGSALDLWSVDLWAFSGDADTLECRAYWCRDVVAARRGDCVGTVVGLDQSHDLRRLVLAAEVVERHAADDLSPSETAALAQAGFSLRIDVPLLSGAEVLGVLSLADTREGRRFTSEERRLLGTLSRLAAVALRTVRIAEAETERAVSLAGLLAAGSGMAASFSADEIVAAVRDEAAQVLPDVPCAADVVLRQDDGTFSRVGAPPGPVASGWRADALARQAADLGRPEQSRTADGRARLLLPLTAGEHAAGYLELTASLARRFRAEEVELAGLLALQAGAALERARMVRALQSRSATDTVTGLYGRWYFYERLYAEVARARRYGQPLALVMTEVDAEEEVLHTHGPAFRDAVLAATARLLLASLRDRVDVACRLGAGRFALLLPSTPPGPEAAGLVAERIRHRVASTPLADDELGVLGRHTVSLGVAGYPADAEDGDELAAAAGERLAAARSAGGDRVEPPLPEPEEDEAEAEDEAAPAPEDEPG